jgi:hypothetical protein
MSWTPGTDGEDGGDPVGAAPALCLEDPAAASAVAGLNASVEALAGCEPWRLPDEDLGALVQVSEVAQRRLLMVQVAAAVEAGKRGLPGRAGFGPGRGAHGDTAALGAWVRSLVNVSRGRPGIGPRSAPCCSPTRSRPTWPRPAPRRSRGR